MDYVISISFLRCKYGGVHYLTVFTDPRRSVRFLTAPQRMKDQKLNLQHTAPNRTVGLIMQIYNLPRISVLRLEKLWSLASIEADRRCSSNIRMVAYSS